MGLYLLSTCGTSVFSYRASDEIRGFLKDRANARTLDDEDQERLHRLVGSRHHDLQVADRKGQARISAELNAAWAVLESRAPGPVRHGLVHTDTVVGRAAAELVRDVLASAGASVDLFTAGGLATDDLPSFQEALKDLTRNLEFLSGYREQGWEVVFNLSGGFKSINAYLQTIGMLRADRCVFIFEGADALMEIPRLPLLLDEVGALRGNLDVFRKLEAGYPVAPQDGASIADVFKLELDGALDLSVWGEAVWDRFRSVLLGEGLLSPLSARLTLDDRARRAFEGLDRVHRARVHLALDKLSAHLDGHLERLPDAHKLKPLQGNPRPPATHEMYLWSDGAAWRLYGILQNGSFRATDMGPHL